MVKVYNMVYSIKGGCGKTTFSIKIANKINKLLMGVGGSKKIKELDNGKENILICNKEGERETCLIDLDLTGTSMYSIFYAIDSEDDVEEDDKFVNDLPFGDEENGKFLKRISTNIKNTNETDGEEGTIKKSYNFNVLFASPRSKDINKYSTNAGFNFTALISYDSFASSFYKFISDNCEMKHVQNIVLDMPPGAYGFANIVYEMLFGKNSKDNNRKHVTPYRVNNNINAPEDVNIRNLFYVLDLDYGHYLSIERELNRWFVENETEIPDNIFFVINNSNNIKGNDEFGEHIKREIREGRGIVNIVKKLQLDEKYVDRIHLLSMEFDVKYCEAAIIGKGIIEENALEEDLGNINYVCCLGDVIKNPKVIDMDNSNNYDKTGFVSFFKLILSK